MIDFKYIVIVRNIDIEDSTGQLRRAESSIRRALLFRNGDNVMQMCRM
jgi:hypothetical protein